MMVNLKIGGEPASTNPVDLLLECHARIRWFSAMALNILEPELALPRVADGAARVHRYFSVALPLHVADEDQSLHGRLESVTSLQPLFEALRQEHEKIEQGLAPLKDAWSRLSGEPGQVGAERRLLGEGTRAMAELLEGHLRREESELFPAVRRLLSPADLSDLAIAMRQRRQPSATVRGT